MTMIVKASESKAVEYAARVLKQGGVIIYPTESSYGIGADAANMKAVRRIFRIKGRIKGKKLPVIVGSLAAIKKHALIDRNASVLIKKFMPGPLTIIVKRKGKGTIAFRIPSHPFALALARKFRKPITATSANVSGRAALYKIRDVINAFGGSVDLIIDAGNLPKRRTSTIYDVKKGKVIRKGPVKERNIVKALR